MDYRDNNTPPSPNPCYTSSCSKNWASPCPRVTPRSTSRGGFNYRPYFIDMTKTRPLLPAASTPIRQLPPSNYPRYFLNTYCRVSRAQPNAASQDFRLLLDCTLRVNSTSPSVCPLPHLTRPTYVHYHDLINLFTF